MPVMIVSAAGDSFDVVDAGPVMATAAAQPAEGRSPHWPPLARKTVEEHPYCACCRGTVDLQVHHVQPFHLHPELELEPSNLIVLCRPHHLLVGHLMSWKSWNSDVRADAEHWLAKIDGRPH